MAAEIDPDLPHDVSTALPARAYCAALLDAMRRHGLLDAGFISTLIRLRPRRAAEIEALAQQLGISVAPVAPVRQDLAMQGRDLARTGRRNAVVVLSLPAVAALAIALLWEWPGLTMVQTLTRAETLSAEAEVRHVHYRWIPEIVPDDPPSLAPPPEGNELLGALITSRSAILRCARRYSEEHRLLFNARPAESLEVKVVKVTAATEGWTIAVRASRPVALKNTAKCVKAALRPTLANITPATAVIGVSATEHYKL